MNVARKIRVLIVDDSAFVRKVATAALSADPGIEVVGTASDPYQARDRIVELAPDVITLDLEMPRMDGLTFLGLLMEKRPMPVVVMSSLSQKGSDHAIEALRLGAVDVLGKPSGSMSFGELGPQLIAKVKNAALVRVRSRPTVAAVPASPPPVRSRRDQRALILLGASTGGTEALREVLTHLPDGLPGIAIVQHIPPIFSRAFAERLKKLCAFDVREAVDGDVLAPGTALVAPGNFHMLLQWQAGQYRVRITDGPAVWHQRPAVDLLFKSATDCGAGPHSIAGVLTGMGQDGAAGLLKLKEAGAATFAQDEESSVVYGMPRVAWENGAARSQISLGNIATHVRTWAETAPASPVAVPALSS